MTLYFENIYGVREKVAIVKNSNEAWNEISEYIKNLYPDWHIYYLRCWETENNEICYDFGSHSEFFYLTSD